jgi:hypothetical protein
MKRLLAVAAVAAPLAMVPGIALANGGGGSANQVSIAQYADFNFAGSQVDVGLVVTCKGGTGVVNVSVDQNYPDSPDPLGAHGSGVQDIVCDGKPHSVGATVVGVIYDAGKAKATATVTAPSGTAKAQRWITVIVV